MIGRYEEAQASLEEARALSPRGQGIRCSIEMTSSKVKEHQADAMATENPIITPTAAALELYASGARRGGKRDPGSGRTMLPTRASGEDAPRHDVSRRRSPAGAGGGGRGLTVEETTFSHPVFELRTAPAAGENRGTASEGLINVNFGHTAPHSHRAGRWYGCLCSSTMVGYSLSRRVTSFARDAALHRREWLRHRAQPAWGGDASVPPHPTYGPGCVRRRASSLRTGVRDGTHARVGRSSLRRTPSALVDEPRVSVTALRASSDSLPTSTACSCDVRRRRERMGVGRAACPNRFWFVTLLDLAAIFRDNEACRAARERAPAV